MRALPKTPEAHCNGRTNGGKWRVKWWETPVFKKQPMKLRVTNTDEINIKLYGFKIVGCLGTTLDHSDCCKLFPNRYLLPILLLDTQLRWLSLDNVWEMELRKL